MTRAERERANEHSRKVAGEKTLTIVELGRMPRNKSYFCIRETTFGYYVQSFDTIVLYVSKKGGRLVNTWGGYTRGTMVHINKALDWIRENTKTVPALKYLSGERYFRLPYRWNGLVAS